MRTVRVSKSYTEALHKLLAYGEQRFGSAVVDEKRKRLSQVIRDILVPFPGAGSFDRDLRIRYHAVSHTPFVLLYDFDDVELRIHLVVHRRADRKRVDLASVEW